MKRTFSDVRSIYPENLVILISTHGKLETYEEPDNTECVTFNIPSEI